MIKDVLLVSALVLSIVLIYRMYIVNQKINNLEEKFIVLDNFSQTLFNFISNKEESHLTNEITYSNNDSKKEDTPENNVESDDIKETENFDTKEILSDMVSQLKESNLSVKEEDNHEVEKIEEEDNHEVEKIEEEDNHEVEEKETRPTEFLSENLVVTQLINESSPVINTKKKQEDLMKLNMTQLKDLAKSKNIPLFQGKNIKKKNILVQDIMNSN
jgi:2,3-bisphosphoglycerate-independent phosphoglycerate mutase